MSPKKMQPFIIEPKDFRLFLYAKMISLKLKPQELAKQLGVSHQAVYALLDGKLKPSAKILEKIGLEIVFRTTDAIEELPSGMMDSAKK